MQNANRTSVAVMSYGATLLSVRTPDRSGNLGEIALGCSQLSNYVTGRHFLGPVIGRFANRISGGCFAIDGQRYKLVVNDGSNTLHGGPEGFDRRNWEGAEVETEFGEGIRVSLDSADGDQGFPGKLRATATYVLTDDNRLITDFTAQTDKPTPLSLSLHGYWNLASSTSPRDICGHELQLTAAHYLPVDSTGIPTGEIAPVEGTRFDFRTPRNLGERLLDGIRDPWTAGGFDHYWAISGTGLRRAAILYDPASGRELTIETDRPGIQVYTANHFDLAAGRRIGEAQARHCAVALETQSFPDSPNQPSFPDTILRPGQVWRSRTIYNFAVR